MGRKDVELYDTLKNAFARSEPVLHGIVESVDKEKATCSMIVGGQLFPVVSLRSVITQKTGVVFYPAVQSVIFACKIPGTNRFVALSFSEIESFHITIDDTEISGSKNGVVLKRGSESLKKIISDLLDSILQMTVTTGVGPSGTPINFAQFEQLKSRLNNLLIS